jgi:hypothetical protein
MMNRDRLHVIEAAGLPPHWLDRAAEVDEALANVTESREVLADAAADPAPPMAGDPP